MTIEPTDTGKGKSKISSAGSWLLRNVLSLLTAVFLGVALGAGIFYAGRSLLGIPVTPAPAALEEADAAMTALDIRIASLETEQADLLQRVESLESENAAQQDAILSLLASDAEASEFTPVDGEASAALEDLLAALSGDLDALTGRIASLEQGAPSDGTAGSHSQEWAILRSMAVMLRAKLYLLEGDYGRAQEDVELARTILAPLGTLPGMDIIVSRIDRVLDDIVETPRIAEGDLDIAWNLLIDFSEQYSSATTD
ncbi:MAG: hypothetical protein JXA97_03145 [Anaerolineales bacterium]|nr:hypothetical protein [Anaerolineales bacterium]